MHKLTCVSALHLCVGYTFHVQAIDIH